MGRIVALDTSVIIPLAGGQSETPDARKRVQGTLRWHREQGDTVALPTPALAECCTFGDELFHEIRFLSFGPPAARLASQLTFSVKRQRDRSIKKQDVKVDGFVLAASVAGGASILYTTDPWFDRIWKHACEEGVSLFGKPLSQFAFEIKGIPTFEEIGGVQLAIETDSTSSV